MSAPISKRQLASVLPVNFSTAGVDRTPIGRAGRRDGSFGQIVGRVVSWLLHPGRRYAVVNELSSLSDRELADIGLNRGDISRVFDPVFAAEHASRR